MRIAISLLWIGAVLVACGGESRKEPDLGSGSEAPVPTPPPDDMIRLPAGGYRGTELHCPTKDTVSEAAGSRKYEQVVHELSSFAIDRRRTSCNDYKICVYAHACPPIGNSMSLRCMDDGLVAVTVAGAKAYCEWRHLQLPSYYEWQAAVRGPEGSVYPGGNTPPKIAMGDSSPAHFRTPEGVEYAINDRGGEWTRDTECTTIRKRLGEPLASGSNGLEVTPVVGDTGPINLDLPGFFHDGAKFRCVNDHATTK